MMAQNQNGRLFAVSVLSWARAAVGAAGREPKLVSARSSVRVGER